MGFWLVPICIILNKYKYSLYISSTAYKLSRGTNRCENARCKRWVFKRVLNLLLSVVSLVLSGKEFQAAGPAWLKQRHNAPITHCFNCIMHFPPHAACTWMHKDPYYQRLKDSAVSVHFISVNIVHKFGDIFFQGLLYRKRYKVVMILHRYTAVSRKQQSFAAVYLYFHLYTW